MFLINDVKILDFQITVLFSSDNVHKLPFTLKYALEHLNFILH